MSWFDLPLDVLREHRPDREEPDDFDDFWRRTLDEHAGAPDVRLHPEPALFPGIAVDDVDYAGFAGQRVRGWLLTPEAGPRRDVGVLHLPGYGRGRGFAHQWLPFAAAGFTVLVMDVRGQGAESDHPGSTPDPGEATGSEVPGFLTRGIAAPETSYLRRLYVDAYRAVDALPVAAPHVTRTAVVAGSQGAGIGIALAGLRTDLAIALLDVPAFAGFRRAIEIGAAGSRAEIARYLGARHDAAEQVFRTLSYFDAVNFAARATTPAHFSVALMDRVCPPSTVYAAYNHYAGEKRITVWPYNGHEGGGSTATQRRLEELIGWSATPTRPR
ncbi:acetylxylan esterase [Polymorphospora rubra]|uniref:Acetylxylan esterase n=1 Tax=Polymorphospora rubra TaxID=338584 RepID=A0A810MY39_9ACTN|nr:acetylxylan esterase [Polymorphospora rubra]BCJ64278.1 acetylxylan esterase [Polymorphospora rubra]